MLQRDCSASPSLHTLVYGNLEKNSDGTTDPVPTQNPVTAFSASQHSQILQDSAVGSSHIQAAQVVDSIQNLLPHDLTGIIQDLVKSQSSSGGLAPVETPAEVQTAEPTVVTCSSSLENNIAHTSSAVAEQSHVDHRGDAKEPPAKKLRTNGEQFEKIQLSVSSVSSTQTVSSIVGTSAVLSNTSTGMEALVQ